MNIFNSKEYFFKKIDCAQSSNVDFFNMLSTKPALSSFLESIVLVTGD